MVRVALCMLWVGTLGCGSDRSAMSEAEMPERGDGDGDGDGDAGVSKPQGSPDAGAAPAMHVEADLNTLVAAFFTEYAREVSVTCPCRVEQHLFPSEQECERQFGNPGSLIDCASRSLAPSDSPALRASLRCNLELYSLRADCLEKHSCAPDDMNTCYGTSDDCGALDGEAFTPVFYNCVMNAQPR